VRAGDSAKEGNPKKKVIISVGWRMDVDLSGNGDWEMEIKRWRPDRFGKHFSGKWASASELHQTSTNVGKHYQRYGPSS
jgi:hypothetical protein